MELVNLRKKTDGSGLYAPVGNLKALDSLVGYVPLGIVGSSFVFARGRRLAAIQTVQMTADDPLVLHGDTDLRGDVEAVLFATSEHIVALTTAGPVRIVVGDDGRPQWYDYKLRFPGLSLFAVDGSLLAAEVGERKLSTAYSGGSLRPADEKALADDLCAAYEQLCATAADAHLGMQPALARYKLYDSEGKLLYTSPAMMAACSNGYQCTDTMSLYSADRQTVAAYTLRARTWRLRLHAEACSDSKVVRAVARAEVYVCPMFHPYDPSGTGTATLSRLGNTDGPFAHVALPGNDVSAATVRKALCHLDTFEKLAAVVANPFGPQEQTFNIVPSFGSVADEVRAVKTVLRASIRHSSSSLPAPGGAFTAHCAAEASGVVAYASPRTVGEAVYAPEFFAASRAEGSATLSVAVLMSDGTCHAPEPRQISWQFSAFGPLASYPSGAARQLLLKLEGDGWQKSASLPLTPLPDGSASVYVADNAVPCVLGNETLELPSDTRVEDPTADVVAFADASDPWNIIATAPVAGGSLMALLPRTGTDQSWEFGRARFIAATRGAILSLAVDSKSRRAAVRTLSACGIERSDAMCAVSGGSVMAVCGGRIVQITPTGRVRRFAADTAYVALGYDAAKDELWALCVDGDCHIFHPDVPGEYYIRNDISACGFAHFNRGMAVAGSSLWLAGMETPGQKSVELSSFMSDKGHRLFSPVEIRAIISGADLNLTFDVWDCGVDNRGKWPLIQTTVRGSVRSPLAFPLMGRAVRKLEGVLSGTVGPDFRFHSIAMSVRTDPKTHSNA